MSSARQWIFASALLTVLLCGAVGGCVWRSGGTPVQGNNYAVAPLQNPMFVPIADREFLWNQLVDTIDDYFKIEREQRMRLVGNMLTEGRIDTFPAPASTLLEPWRKDSTPGFEKRHATLQSLRRHAEVRVTPTQGGYLVDVAVYKELEDLEQPVNATVGSVTFRHDNSLVRSDQKDQARLAPGALGWIAQGRDASLEQQILRHLQARLSGIVIPDQQPISADLDVHAQPRP